jgi:NADH-quinone oxidoreductase subunit F
MVTIANREMLNQLQASAKQTIESSKCRILICAGTGCLAGGSATIFEK